jgi:DNA-binding CsgD family transcriptional regulator
VARIADEAALTRAERVVVEQAVRGLSNKEIGRVLGTSISTVRTQLLSATKKVGVRSRSELAYLVFCESHRRV